MFTDEPAVLTWMIAMAPQPRPEPRRHWWRDLITGVHRDARDAWLAARESEHFMQWEDDQYRAAFPPPTLKAVMVGLASGHLSPERVLS
jgi:hypothetical protein